MSELNANLIVVQWGVLSVFGVVVGLLITPTDRYVHQFLASAAEGDREKAKRWVLTIRATAWTVLSVLGILSFLAAVDAGLGFTGRLTTNGCLLVTPLLAQLGFVGLIQGLISPVPPIAVVPLAKLGKAPSPGGQRPATVLRFVNNSSSEVYFQWVDFQGHLDKRIFREVPPASEYPQPTYAGHRFLVILKDNKELGTVVATAVPGKVVIEQSHLPIS